METLTKPVKLNRDTVQTLDEIRAGADNPLYGATPARAEELFKRHIMPLLEGSGMSGLQVMHYGWFLRELARLWRAKTGRELAFHLELCIRKWLGLGLETNTTQFLVTEVYLRLKARTAGDCHPLSAEENGGCTSLPQFGAHDPGQTQRLRVSEPTPGPRPLNPGLQRTPEPGARTPDFNTKTPRREGFGQPETAKDAKSAKVSESAIQNPKSKTGNPS